MSLIQKCRPRRLLTLQARQRALENVVTAGEPADFIDGSASRISVRYSARPDSQQAASGRCSTSRGGRRGHTRGQYAAWFACTAAAAAATPSGAGRIRGKHQSRTDLRLAYQDHCRAGSDQSAKISGLFPGRRCLFQRRYGRHAGRRECNSGADYSLPGVWIPARLSFDASFPDRHVHESTVSGRSVAGHAPGSGEYRWWNRQRRRARDTSRLFKK